MIKFDDNWHALNCGNAYILQNKGKSYEKQFNTLEEVLDALPEAMLHEEFRNKITTGKKALDRLEELQRYCRELLR